MVREWNQVKDNPPPLDEVVLTLSDGGLEQPLKRGSGGLWFVADGSMYVYYQPKFWHPLDDKEGAQ